MKQFEIDFLAEYDDQSILNELRRIAKVSDSDLITKSQIIEFGRVSPSTVIRRFGSIRRACELAGLKSYRFMKATDEELLNYIVSLWQMVLEQEGRRPEAQDLKKFGIPFSKDTVKRRFGSWKKALYKAQASVTETSFDDELQAPIHSRIPVPLSDSPRKRTALSVRKRFFVLKRDSFSCVRCGASGNGVRLEVHHRVPFAKGGSDSLTNLETLCFDCNRGQRDSLV